MNIAIVAGVLGLALASGVSLDDAMGIANTAAGRVVEKKGTKPIYSFELEKEISSPSENKQFFNLPFFDNLMECLPQSHHCQD